MSHVGNFIVGLLFILFGFFVIFKADQWIVILVEMWPWKFSNFEIKLMKVAWRIGGLFLIGFGIYILVL